MSTNFDPARRMGAMSARSLDALPSGLALALDGRRIVSTGCTGFFGAWTLSVLSELRTRGVDVRIRIASRNPLRFLALHPQWREASWIEWVSGEAKDLEALGSVDFDFVLHMAASSDAATNAADPLFMMESMVSSACAMARLGAKAKAPLLMVSSGAVYGKRSAAMGPARETDDERSAPSCLDQRQAYGEAKRVSEMAVACQSGLVWTVARPFAFLGPHLPLSSHFAAGNFLSDAARGKQIAIKGDGSPVRSFMHPADLAAWQLWLLALGPRHEAVNVGSAEPVSLLALAHQIASLAQAPQPIVLGSKSKAEDVYVPDISKAESLGLKASVSKSEAMLESLQWLHAMDGQWIMDNG